MLLLAFRLAWLQIVKADDLQQMAIQQQTRDVPVEAKRGDILDRNGNKLATSATCYTVWVRPAELKDGIQGDENISKDTKIDQVVTELAKYTGKDKAYIQKALSGKSSIVKIAKYLDKENASKIKKMGTPGVVISKGNKRFYSMGNFASQTLGSVTDDNVGRTGIELQYDQYLSGISGRWIKDTDLNGGELYFGQEAYYEAEDGYNVVMTLDEVIQYYEDEPDSVEKVLVAEYKISK